jgi:hypothetical protein
MKMRVTSFNEDVGDNGLGGNDLWRSLFGL